MVWATSSGCRHEVGLTDMGMMPFSFSRGDLMSNEKNAEVTTLAFICEMLLLPVAIAVRGWSIMLLWAWFIVPLGVVPVGWAHALGLSVFAALFVRSKPSKEEGGARVLESFFNGVLGPALVVFVGWIVSHWV